MKNISICVALFLCLFSVRANQENPVQEKDEINATIEQFLSNAEESINEMDFDRALNQLNTALELSHSINHQKYIALSSSLLAQMYYVRYETDQAATEIQRAVSIQREIGDELGLAHSYVTYGKIFHVKQDTDRALQYFDLAEELFEKNEDIEGLGIVDINRAVALLRIQEFQEARQLLERAKKRLKSSPNQYEKSRALYFNARANQLLGNLDVALALAKECLSLSNKNNFGSMILSSRILMSDIYALKGDFEKSLNFLRLSNKTRDSIHSLNKEAIASDASARYGLDAMQNKFNELSRQNEAHERSLKVNKLTTILSVALITILSLLTLSLYKNNNLRARANDLLQKKNSELITAKENAEKASTAKAQFLSTITHELRTPLYAVTGLTHLLLEESPTENQKEHLNSLKFSGEYLLSLINNILDLNKLEANKVELLETSFNLKKRISDVLVALKNSAEDKNTKLHLDFENSIPKKLKGDPLKISQILINLIGNSIKFTEEGHIWVRVKKVSQTGNQVVLKFEVQDDGEGISKEKQKAIFDSFTQGSLQINRKFGGTGLGLSIVKNLLNLMDSEIHLESELGEGSIFYFEMPFEALELTPTIAAGEVEKEPEKLTNDIMHHKKILVVEDNKINQMITRKILEKHQVNCDVADNGTTAIEKVKNNAFDLILMDIHMPGISGIEATIAIRKFNAEIPIIALTAVTLDENLDEFYLNGFNDIIPKPYKTEEFFLKINKYLAQTKASV
ncbi:ATP-binding protein [Salinimicrobium sp. GXAS 041]|uniref:hybrid sensor histidine kinase/response regulator n=1 Tax=Salinimicrobium sp. GXAS 041 TaxID=3400806 RepID=UPI003C7758A2